MYMRSCVEWLFALCDQFWFHKHLFIYLRGAREGWTHGFYNWKLRNSEYIDTDQSSFERHTTRIHLFLSTRPVTDLDPTPALILDPDEHLPSTKVSIFSWHRYTLTFCTLDRSGTTTLNRFSNQWFHVCYDKKYPWRLSGVFSSPSYGVISEHTTLYVVF